MEKHLINMDGVWRPVSSLIFYIELKIIFYDCYYVEPGQTPFVKFGEFSFKYISDEKRDAEQDRVKKIVEKGSGYATNPEVSLEEYSVFKRYQNWLDEPIDIHEEKIEYCKYHPKNVLDAMPEEKAYIIYGKEFEQVKKWALEWVNRKNKYESRYYTISTLPYNFNPNPEQMKRQLALVESTDKSEWNAWSGSSNYNGDNFMDSGDWPEGTHKLDLNFKWPDENLVY